jgi:hypothetical protein
MVVQDHARLLRSIPHAFLSRNPLFQAPDFVEALLFAAPAYAH